MICNVHNVLYRLWKLVYVATYSQLQDVSHLNIHLWPLMVIRLFVLASLSTWAVTLGQLVIKCAWVRFYSGLTTRTRVHSMQALKCARAWALFCTFVCFCPSVKPVFHSSSVWQSCRGNRTSRVESAHFTWKQTRTHTQMHTHMHANKHRSVSDQTSCDKHLRCVGPTSIVS